MKTSIETTSEDLLNYIKPYKSREKISFICPNCNTEFFKTKKYIQERIHQLSYRHRKSLSLTCSRSCSTLFFNSTHGKSPIKVTCLNCNKIFKKRPSQIKKTSNHFCSRSCAGAYNNTHKSHGTRRSKVESWLEDKLVEKYPELEIHFNRKDTINSELDVYIPMLNLAFELNGVFHYEPIYGADKLAKIKNNDDRKFQACIERGIELCIINTSQMIRFSEKKSSKYLKIIVDLIDAKLNH